MTNTPTRSRRRQVVCSVALVCGLTLWAIPVWAGQTQEATIFGQVTDESGAVLPGVTVTVSSPALLVKQIVEVTSGSGEYRVTPLPLGIYTVEFTLAGFQTQRREGVRLTAGFVAKVDVQLKVGSVEETVTVSGASPVVDVKTTSAGTQVAREILETVPTTRNSFNSLLTLAAGARPAVDNGTNLSSDVVFRAFGRQGESWITIDGLPISPPDNDGSGFQTASNYQAIEEAAVQTIAASAEAPTSGIQLNVVTKSGSNDFRGTVFAAQTADWTQRSDNLNDTLKAQGLLPGRRFSKRWDRSGDLGGRLVRDKLWFWAAGRNRQENENVLGAFIADGSQSQLTHDQRFINVKITSQLTPTQQLIGSYNYKDHLRDDGPTTRFSDVDQIAKKDFVTNPQTQLTWQWVKTNKFLSVQGGLHRIQIPYPPILTANAAWRDDVSGYQGGLEPRAGKQYDQQRWSQKATLNWYKADWSGNHDFKLGALYTLARRIESLVDIGLPAGNYTLRYRASGSQIKGAPSEIRVKNNPIDPQEWLGYLGVFFEDSWAVNRRLTANLGVRYANDRSWLPTQCRVAAPREFASVFPAECWARKDLKTWNPVAPRLHAAYDLTGDGKTVLKGGWGRFYVMHDRVEQFIANPNAEKEARFKWKDLNSNNYFDAGESNLDLNGPDFLGVNLPGAAYTIEGPGGSTTVSAKSLVDNPDLKEQGSDEFVASVEREVIRNLSLRVTGLYVHEFNTQRLLNPLRPYAAYNIPVNFADPGPDNVAGTADDPGTAITYYDYSASLKGAAFDATQLINDSAAEANFKSFEVAVNKRLSNRWQMLASYSATKKHIPVPRNSEYTPNAEIFAANNTWEWLFRGTGSYLFPKDLQISTNILVQSGFKWARTVSATGGSQITSIVLWAEPVGTRDTSTQTTMALAIEKGFRLHEKQRLAIGANILNVFNANFDTDYPQTRGGGQFGYSTRIVPPTLGEFTVRYTF